MTQAMCLWDPNATLRAHGAAHLDRLCRAVASRRREEALAVFRTLTTSWGSATVRDAENADSRMTLDGSPMETSIVLGGPSPSVRFLAKVFANVAADSPPWEGVMEACDELQRTHGLDADTSVLTRIRDVIAPLERGSHAVSLGLGVALDERGGGLVRAYVSNTLNQLVDWAEILSVAGICGPARSVASAIGAGDEFFGLSVDLCRTPDARVKLYFKHAVGTVTERLRRLTCLDGSVPEGAFAAFVSAMSGSPLRDGDLAGRALCSTVHLIAGSERVARVTCNVICDPRLLLDDDECGEDVGPDETFRARLVDFLGAEGLDASWYERALASMTRIPLGRESLIHNVVSLQYQRRRPVVTAYFNPRMYAYHHGLIPLSE